MSSSSDQKRGSWAETISSASEDTLPMEDNSSSSYVEKTVKSLEKRPSSSKPLSKNYWARKYHHLVADFEDQHEELEDLHDEVRDVKDALKEEKRRCSRYKSEAAEMKRDLKAVVADRENLYQECLKMKELLKQRDADRDSLVAQVNLLIQVGNMNKTSSSTASPERNTAPDESPTRSRQMTNIKQELATRVTDKKNKRGAMNNLRAELSSFFSAKQSSNDHHDTEESLNDKSPSNRSSIFQRRGSEELDGTANSRRSSRGSFTLPFGQESASGGSLWRSWSSEDA